jgi:hypothetical protein
VVGLPPQLLTRLSLADAAAAEAWWAGLSEADHCEVASLCDERQDRCFFGLAPFLDGVMPPVVVGGRFVPSDDAAGWSDWSAALFEHLVAQPDPMLYEPPFVRTFHIGGRLTARYSGPRTAMALSVVSSSLARAVRVR